MEKGSLQNIMNEMVQRFEGIKTEGPNSYQTDPWTEIKAYIGLDPVLGDLHKQYLDARAQHKKLLTENGKDDAMTEIAFDVRASAVSAIDTRVLELRQDDALRSVVAYRMRRAELAKEKELAANTKEYWKKIRGYNEEQAKAQSDKNKEEGVASFFAALMFLSVMTQMFNNARQKLSIASIFDAVRDPEYSTRAVAA